MTSIKAYINLNFKFHRQIVKGALNKRLEEMIRSAGQQWMWCFFRDIYLAFNEKDGKKAGACIEDHINEGGRRLLDAFPLKKENSG